MGALFFIIIVGLVISTLTAVFIGQSSFIGVIHSNAESSGQLAGSTVNVRNVTFGALMNDTYIQKPVPVYVNQSAYLACGAVNFVPPSCLGLEPVSNMNFTGGIGGWYTSYAFPTLVDAGQAININTSKSVPLGTSGVTTAGTTNTQLQDSGATWTVNQWVNYLLTYTSGPAKGESQTVLTNTATSVTTASFSPAPDAKGDSYEIATTNDFAMTVQNNNLAGSIDWIATVSLLVDSNFTNVAALSTPAGWNAPIVVGNNITWSTPTSPSGPLSGIAPGPAFALPFDWSATVPAPSIPSTFYQTVVLTWFQTGVAHHAVDTAIGTMDAPAVNATAGIELAKAADTTIITPTTSGLVPGGLTAGYDPLVTASRSGPGSAFVDFQPAYSAQAVPEGEQIEGVANLTTAFQLTSAEALSLDTAATTPGFKGCCTLSWTSNLDSLASTPDALVYYHFWLINPNGAAAEISSNGCSPSLPQYFGWTNPTLANYFGPTGWSEGISCFNPPSNNANWLGTTLPYIGNWLPGRYQLVLSVTEFLPSGLPSGLSPSVSMHFDDIGLNLGVTGSGSGSQTFSMVFPRTVGSGVTTAGSSTTILQDSAATWTSNQWIGDYLLYETGPDAGQEQMITSNFPTSISVVPAAFTSNPTPAGGDSFTIQAPIASTQAQKIQLGLNLTGLSSAYPNTVAYVYVADKSLAENGLTGPVIWSEAGSVTFNGTGTVQAVIPLPEAAYYIDNTGSLTVKVVVIAPNSIALHECANQNPLGGNPPSTTCFTLSVSAFAVVQTSVEPRQVVFTFANTEGAIPVHLVDLYIAGPNMLGTFSISNWVDAGTTVEICRGGGTTFCPGNFAWVPGQTYTVTVTTAGGVTFSSSFVAPS